MNKCDLEETKKVALEKFLSLVYDEKERDNWKENRFYYGHSFTHLPTGFHIGFHRCYVDGEDRFCVRLGGTNVVTFRKALLFPSKAQKAFNYLKTLNSQRENRLECIALRLHLNRIEDKDKELADINQELGLD